MNSMRYNKGSNSKHILYVVPTSTFGGASSSLSNLLRGLDKKRFVPHLATSHTYEFVRRMFPETDVMHLPFKRPPRRSQTAGLVSRWSGFSRVGHFLSICKHLWWIWSSQVPLARKLKHLGKQHHIELVHLNNGLTPAGILAARMLKVPCVVHYRASPWPSVLNRFFAHLASHSIAVSKTVRRDLISMGIPPAKISVIYDALDPGKFNDQVDIAGVRAEFKCRPKELLFGLFGRIVPWKGPLEFVKSAVQVFRQIPNSRAFIVGDVSDDDISYFRQLKSVVSELGIKDKVVFTGYRTDIPALMAMMDVVVHASIEPEPFGMVLIESMAVGKPVVATAAGGPLEIVKHGETGLLIPCRNTSAMADAIVRLLSDSKLAHRIGVNARDFVLRKFTYEDHARQVEHVYQKLLNIT
ncbi:TPA: glycosyltransferase family 1 protein [Candidatus Bathyarchaeota archaeon]|nr:glycosyltransferase family 1 protein [Candidatus Bathyarchaeota archaeon]